MKKRIMSLFVAVLIVLSVLTVPALAESDKIKIAAVGDSLTRGLINENGSYSTAYGYPELLAQMLGDGFEVGNFGKAAYGVYEGHSKYYKNLDLYENSKAFAPDVVLIIFGTNDAKVDYWQEIKGSYYGIYRDFVQEYINLPSKPQVIIGIPTPVFGESSYALDRPAQNMSEMRDTVRKVAKDLNLKTVDLEEMFKNDEALFADGLHYNEAGAKRVAEAFKGLINTQKEIKISDLPDKLKAETFKGSNGTEIPYRLYVPENYNPNKKYSFLLFLHGAGNRGSDNKNQISQHMGMILRILNGETAEIDGKSVKLADEVIILIPQCAGSNQWVDTPWGKTPDPSYNVDEIPQSASMTAVLELVDKLKSSYNLDTNKFYASGLSMGGFGVWDLLMRYPDMFAAAVPMGSAADLSKANVLKNIPIWTFHQILDTRVASEGTVNIVKELVKAGGDIKFTAYFEKQHDAWTKGYAEKDLLNWLFSHKNNVPAKDNSGALEGVSEWFTDELALSFALGFIPESVVGNYKSNITRLQFCEAVTSIIPDGTAYVRGDETFADTDNPAVKRAYSLGIVNGVSDTAFDENANITREAMCTMLYRAYKLIVNKVETAPETSAPDKAEVSDWAKEAVNFISAQGIMKGDDKGNLSPKANTTSEQALALVYRTFYQANTYNK